MWIKCCVLIFSTTFVWNISHSKKNSERYYHISLLVFVYSTPYSCRISKKLEFYRHIWEKYSNTKFHENPSSGNRSVPWGWTDRQTSRSWEPLFAVVRMRLKFLRQEEKISSVCSDRSSVFHLARATRDPARQHGDRAKYWVVITAIYLSVPYLTML